MKSILILKDDYKSYFTLIGCVMQNRKVDLILQIEAECAKNYELASEMNDWLEEKGYPQIVCGCQTSTILDTIEAARGKEFTSFPNEIHREIENNSGLIADCDYDDIQLMDCIESWGWDDVDISDVVMHLSDLPTYLQKLLDDLSLIDDGALPYAS